MPLPYQIDPASRLATVMMLQRVHGRDIAETMRAIYRDAAWAAGYRILWDGGNIIELLFEKEDFPTFDRILIQHLAVAPSCEVILAKRQLDYAMALSYAALAKSRHPVYVCRSMSEATAMLRAEQTKAAPG